MNAAAGSITIATVMAQAPGAEVAAPETDSGDDFTAAMAAAVAPALATAADAGLTKEQPPEGADTAATLAWLASMLSGAIPGPVTSAIAEESELVDAGAGAATRDATMLQTDATAAAADEIGVAVDPKAVLARAANQQLAPHQETAADVVAAPAQDAAQQAAAKPIDAFSRLIAALPDAAPTLRSDDSSVTATSTPAQYVNAREAAMPVAEAAAQTAVRSAVGTPRWADEIGSHLVRMSLRGQQEGSLTLSPDHLGPVEVRISVTQDSTSVWFGAQHADTRAALTEALPRLRELFNASGLSLGDTGVSQQMPRQDAKNAEAATFGADGVPLRDEAAMVTPAVRHLRSALLDAWA